jgi:3-hydroxyethyl bacteriochlorophyllide a dehydrogenase
MLMTQLDAPDSSLMTPALNTLAVVLQAPETLAIQQLELSAPGDEDVIVDIAWSGISTGTERLLYTGRMPPFPGMGYPLVPGYESVGRIVSVGSRAPGRVGDMVFVPGARCFGDVRGLFGGAAARVVIPGAKALPIPERLGEQGVLLALAATAWHAVFDGKPAPVSVPDLIIGHGVLGRLLARIAMVAGGDPVVWELNPDRRHGATGYAVIDPAEDTRKNYRAIYDVSGDSKILDTLVGRLGFAGEIVLAGFYSDALAFSFPPAFMREARFRIAAQWAEADLNSVREHIESGRLPLDGLITHREAAADAATAYHTAFHDPACLKMVLDWRI